MEIFGIGRPVHSVKLTYDYYIGKYEVTFEEYDFYSETTGKTKKDDEGWGRVDRPVIHVSWNEAVAYCNWLSEKEDLAKAYDINGNLLDKKGKQTTDITKVVGYRLPTEAEWEYAARGGHQSTIEYKYAGSDDLKEVGWYWQNSGDTLLSGYRNSETMQANNCKTQPIGQKCSNELDLYDMSGNVAEWCHDYWNDKYYDNSPGVNPVNCDRAFFRILRGGSWNSGLESCRVSDRGSSPGDSNRSTGFRIAKTK